MSEKVIIGFTGKLQSGKSTCAKFLLQDYGFHRTRFADKMKGMLKKLGLTDAQVDGNEKDKPCALLGGKTPRYALQTLGTEWGRTLMDSEIWVRATMWGIDRMPNLIVIDDVRFINEANAIKELGGIVVKVLRPGYVIPMRDGLTPEEIEEWNKPHLSETEMDHIFPNYVIEAKDMVELKAAFSCFVSWKGLTKPEDREKEHQKVRESLFPKKDNHVHGSF